MYRNLTSCAEERFTQQWQPWLTEKLVVHNKDKLAVEKTTLPYKASNDHKTALMYRKQNSCRYDNLAVQKIAFLKWKKWSVTKHDLMKRRQHWCREDNLNVKMYQWKLCSRENNLALKNTILLQKIQSFFGDDHYAVQKLQMTAYWSEETDVLFLFCYRILCRKRHYLPPASPPPPAAPCPCSPGRGTPSSRPCSGSGSSVYSVQCTVYSVQCTVYSRLLSSWPLGKILTGPVYYRVTLDTLSGYLEPWSSKLLGSDRERTY